jgi:hypothetical protein
MRIACPKCGKVFDERLSWMQCPHKTFLTNEEDEQRLLGLALLGKRVQFLHRDIAQETYRVTVVHWNGMVEIDKMPGEFAPDLFRVIE